MHNLFQISNYNYTYKLCHNFNVLAKFVEDLCSLTMIYVHKLSMTKLSAKIIQTDERPYFLT